MLRAVCSKIPKSSMLAVIRYSAKSSKVYNRDLSSGHKNLPHSANDLQDPRFYWWNMTQLDRVKQQYSLEEARQVLDVGCGKGHWTYLVSYMTNKFATIHAMDTETTWVNFMKTNFRNFFASQHIQPVQGNAEKIPFQDNSFDLVTCQTLLIHVNNPDKVVKEMVRVAKKPGKLLIAEPSNMAASVLKNSVTKSLNKDEYLKLIELHYICEQGKINLGQGNISVGDILLEILYNNNLKNINVSLADRSYYLVPPYDEKSQKALIDEALSRAKKGYWVWDKEQSLEYYLAGGGSNEEFQKCWDITEKVNDMCVTAIQNHTFVDVGGQVMYLYYAETAEM